MNTMIYKIEDFPLITLLPAISQAEDRLARLDEAVKRSAVGAGFSERAHFFDAAASMWVAGELVHVEDLVLHDANMDVRAPTHELTIAHAILRARRRIELGKPDWALSETGIATLTGATEPRGNNSLQQSQLQASPDVDEEDEEPLAAELAHIDAILERSTRLIDDFKTRKRNDAPQQSKELSVGDLVIRDADWDEAARLAEWRNVLQQVQAYPPTFAAAILFDAWERLEPLQRQHWLGPLLVTAYLRESGKVASHLLAFNVGLRNVMREKRRSQNLTTRLLAFLQAMTIAAENGTNEIIRLQHAREQMERKLRGRRSNSHLPTAIDLILSRPVVSASMIAQAAQITPRGALNLIGELGVREMTGRGRYRAWGIV